MSFLTTVGRWIDENPGKALGAGGGFLVGILLLTAGPLKTLLVVILVLIGLIIGKLVDDRVSLTDYLPGFIKKRSRSRDDDLS
jgi:uncharacterized membrane protein